MCFVLSWEQLQQGKVLSIWLVWPILLLCGTRSVFPAWFIYYSGTPQEWYWDLKQAHSHERVISLILQNKTWNSSCFEWALTFNPDLFQENINRFCSKADAPVFVNKCRLCSALTVFFQLLCGKKNSSSLSGYYYIHIFEEKTVPLGKRSYT